MGFAGKCAGAMAVLAVLGGCQMGGHQQRVMGDEPGATPPASGAAPASGPSGTAAAGVSASDLRDALSELDKGHHDKMKLAFWVSTPLKSINPAFKPFYEDMAKRQKELAKELEDWAKARRIDLTYHYTNDPMSQGQKVMEDDSEKEARGENKEDFERDMLISMKQDYGWDRSLSKALLVRVTDPGLKSYLEKSVRVHEEGMVAIRGLLRRYKFSG